MFLVLFSARWHQWLFAFLFWTATGAKTLRLVGCVFLKEGCLVHRDWTFDSLDSGRELLL